MSSPASERATPAQRGREQMCWLQTPSQEPPILHGQAFMPSSPQLPQVGVGGEGYSLRFFAAALFPAAVFQLQLSALLVGQLADRWLFWSPGPLGQLFLPVIMPHSFLSALLASRFVLPAPPLPPPLPLPQPPPGQRGRRPSFRLAAFLSHLPFTSGFLPQSVPALPALTGLTRLVQNWHVCRWG